MVILDKPISREELVRLADNFYGDMIKGVVDVENIYGIEIWKVED